MFAQRSKPEPGPTERNAALRELVRRHRVYWEVRPEPTLNRDDEVVKTGIQLGLWGTFERPDHPFDPDSPECLEVYRNLRTIAKGILPDHGEDRNYRIGGFENAIDVSTRSGRKEIEVLITVASGESRDHVDEGELHTLREMKRRLKDLGAPEGRWLRSAR